MYRTDVVPETLPNTSATATSTSSTILTGTLITLTLPSRPSRSPPSTRRRLPDGGQKLWRVECLRPSKVSQTHFTEPF